MISYTLRPMESNSLKYSSILMVYLIELKFGIYIIGHHQMNPLDFGECRIYTILYRGIKNNS